MTSSVRSAGVLGSLLLVAVSLLLGGVLRAEGGMLRCPAQPESADTARKVAGEWFAKGTRFVGDARFAEAEQAFRCSNLIVAHPATLLNLAKAAKMAGHKETAIAVYRKYIELYPTEPKVVLAQSELSNLLEPEDPSPAPVAAAKLLAEEVSPPSEVAEQDEDASAEESVSASGPVGPEVTVENENTRPVSHQNRFVKPGIALVSMGASGTVVGIVLQSVALFYRGNSRQDGITLDDYNQFEDRRSVFQTGAAVSFAAAGTALIVGISLLLVGRRGDGDIAERGPITIGLTPTDGTFRLRF